MYMKTVSIWKLVGILGTLVASAAAVDNRYVTDKVFQAFKEGSISAIFDRLDKMESRNQRIEDKLDKLLEK